MFNGLTKAVVCSAVLAMLTWGCGGGDSKAPAPAPAAAAAARKTVDPATAGSITGVASFTGTAPKAMAIKMMADAKCHEAHKEPVYTEEVVVNSNNTLRHVLVYVKAGLEGYSFPAPSEPFNFDQHGCVYMPHVAGVRTGQKFLIKNSDPTLHNINCQAKINQPFNKGMPTQDQVIEVTFDKPEMPVHFKCDVHPWMGAYIGVFSHPGFAVTGEDGSFSIPNLPPGNYTIAAWHEKYGEQTMEVTVPASGSADANFTFGAGA